MNDLVNDLAPLALRCRIEDVHPAAEKERKYLKLKLSTSLLHEQFELFYPWHEKLKFFFETDCPTHDAKLIGSNRVFHIIVHADDSKVLLELDAYLASCDIGQMEAGHLPCDFLFIVKLGENRDQILMLAKCLKETLPVVFEVRQGELDLPISAVVSDALAAEVETHPDFFGKDTKATVERQGNLTKVTVTDQPKEKRVAR
jgi:hypothetical protein